MPWDARRGKRGPSVITNDAGLERIAAGTGGSASPDCDSRDRHCSSSSQATMSSGGLVPGYRIPRRSGTLEVGGELSAPVAQSQQRSGEFRALLLRQGAAVRRGCSSSSLARASCAVV